jgi:hypothetical protein
LQLGVAGGHTGHPFRHVISPAGPSLETRMVRIAGSTSDQRVVNVIVKLNQEIFGAPRSQFSPHLPDSLSGHPATRSCRDVDSFVHELYARSRIAQA